MADEVPAVSAAVRILERLAESWPETLSPTKLTNDLGLNRSTCYNILGTLQAAGWATAGGGRTGWTLGPRLLLLTGVPDNVREAIVQQEIDGLGTQLGLTVFAAEWRPPHGHQVVATTRRVTGLHIGVNAGHVFEFSAPALMKTVLAWRDALEIDELLDTERLIRFTEYTRTDHRQIKAVLAEVRQRGYAESHQEYDLAQSAVAAPVFSSEATVRQVLCCLGFPRDLESRGPAKIGELMRRAAGRITDRTGGRRPPGYLPDQYLPA
jgi:DNA-binding IclR family transcriptional regulator